MRFELFTNSFLSIISCLIITIGCSNGQAPSSGAPENAEANPTKHTYAQMPLPQFLEALFLNHFLAIKSVGNQAFTKFCEANGLAANDSLNQSNYFRIQFLHDLFTSTGAYDCNKGGILKLPYFWHWTTPNPRHEIEYLGGESPQNLTMVEPPPGFQRYNSLAEIDRTPSLYLSDMVTEKPKYRHPECGDFYTFGWCSEREMAFSELLNMMGLESKVVVNGNHSWTESLLQMAESNGGKKWILVKTDNTFDNIGWSKFEDKPDHWRAELGATKTDRWYNIKARSKAEQESILAIEVLPSVSRRMEDAVAFFYNNK